MNKIIKLTKREAFDLNQVLNSEKDKGGVLFKYFASKNTLVLSKSLEAFEVVRVDTLKIREPYDKAVRDEIILPYTLPQTTQSNVFEFKLSKELNEARDIELKELGSLSKELSIRINNYTTDISNKIKKIQTELDEKFKDDLLSFNEKNESLTEILKETMEVELRLIDIENLPQDISSQLMDLIVLHELIES